MAGSSTRDLGRFLEDLLDLLDRGSFTATYKYAVLLGLIDLCVEGADATRGVAPTTVTTRQLAEKVVALYWPQARPWRFEDDRVEVLRQVNMKNRQASIVRLVQAFRARHEDRSPARARRADPTGFEKLIRKVEWELIKNPLPRLQIIGRETVPLLYRIAWDLSIEGEKRRVTAYQRGVGDFDNRIRLLDGVGEGLAALGPLLRPVLHREWAAMVARFNDLPESRLEEFLFGSRREGVARLARPLAEMQHGDCFYCGRPLKGAVEVDHFVPWSRHPDDGLDNLVAAHRSCNGGKSDLLAAPEHLARWLHRSPARIERLARHLGWPRDRDRTRAISSWMYRRVRPGSVLWIEGNKRRRRVRRATPEDVAAIARAYGWR